MIPSRPPYFAAARARGAFFSLLLLAAGCRNDDESPARAAGPQRPRILVVAVDGFEWDVALPLVRDGRMPALRGLMARGVFGLLESMKPTLSPVIWTSVATGKTPDKHQIRGFWLTVPDGPDSGRQRFYTTLDRRTKAFWNILTDAGRRVAVVGWFVSFPAEPVSGVMVSQTNTATREAVRAGDAIAKGGLIKGVEGQVFPPQRQAEMLAVLAGQDEALPRLLNEIFGEFRHPPGPQAAQLFQASQWAFRADATYAEIARRLAAEPEPYDLTAVYLGGADVVGHRFWRYMRPELYEVRPDPADVEAAGHVIPAYYAYLDGVIASLLEAAGPDATVFVVADHGMHASNLHGRFAPEDTGRRLRSGDHGDAPVGVFVAAGPCIRAPPRPSQFDALLKSELPVVGSVLDVTPTLLGLLDVPIGEDMDGEVLTDLIDPTWLAAHPVRTVSTHDTPDWLATRGRAVETPDAEQRLEQLRSLGYID